jgi:hypothetical protein
LSTLINLVVQFNSADSVHGYTKGNIWMPRSGAVFCQQNYLTRHRLSTNIAEGFCRSLDVARTRMEIPKEFFTLQSMLTLTGATGAVYVVCNTIQAAFDFNPKWLALLLSQLISLTGVALTGGQGLDYFVGVVNGCLIFSSAAGVVAMKSGGRAAESRGGDAVTATDIRRGVSTKPREGKSFFSPWF